MRLQPTDATELVMVIDMTVSVWDFVAVTVATTGQLLRHQFHLNGEVTITAN